MIQKQNGFITMLIVIFVVLVAAIGLVFWRVMKANS